MGFSFPYLPPLRLRFQARALYIRAMLHQMPGLLPPRGVAQGGRCPCRSSPETVQHATSCHLPCWALPASLCFTLSGPQCQKKKKKNLQTGIAPVVSVPSLASARIPNPPPSDPLHPGRQCGFLSLLQPDGLVGRGRGGDGSPWAC